MSLTPNRTTGMIRRLAMVACLGVLLCEWSCGTDTFSDGVVVAKEDSGLWPDLVSIFRSDIEDCTELRAWLKGDGARMECVSRNTSFEMRLRYIPSAVRYCMAPQDAFGEIDEVHPTSAITKGLATTQYILEVQPLAGSAFDTPKPVRYTESDIVEIIGKDTVPCAFVHHEPPFPTIPFHRSILGFDHPESSSDRQLLLRDRDGSHGGDILLRFAPGVFKAYDKLNVDSTLTQWGA